MKINCTFLEKLMKVWLLRNSSNDQCNSNATSNKHNMFQIAVSGPVCNTSSSRYYHATAIYISAKRKCLIAFPENRRCLSNYTYTVPARAKQAATRVQVAHTRTDTRVANNHMSFKSPASESFTFKNITVPSPFQGSSVCLSD